MPMRTAVADIIGDTDEIQKECERIKNITDECERIKNIVEEYERMKNIAATLKKYYDPDPVVEIITSSASVPNTMSGSTFQYLN